MNEHPDFYNPRFFKIDECTDSLITESAYYKSSLAESEMIINWQLESKYLIASHKNLQSIKTIFGFTDSHGSSGM